MRIGEISAARQTTRGSVEVRNTSALDPAYRSTHPQPLVVAADGTVHAGEREHQSRNQPRFLSRRASSLMS